MSTSYRRPRTQRQDDLVRLLLGNRQPQNRQREWELEFEAEGEFEGEQLLNATQLASAVRANRLLARQIGWGCVGGGRVSVENPALRTLLGIAAGASEEDIANAIERWQIANMGGRGDGQLGPRTWTRMNVVRPGRFRQLRIPVNFGGRQLGVIEKTAPYIETRTATNFGVDIEFAFRVTNMDAVRRAGFVDGANPHFRWIQVFELRRFGSADAREARVQTLRRRAGGRVIDPTDALEPLDAHPYYWDEDASLNPSVDIANFVNRPAQNGLCYDLIFFDGPTMPTTAALPGSRAYFNFETALVGVRLVGTTRRNVILNTVLWGFDIVQVSGVPTLHLSSVRQGPFGGSASLKRVMSVESTAARPAWRDHCFVGSGYSRAATCR